MESCREFYQAAIWLWLLNCSKLYRTDLFLGKCCILSDCLFPHLWRPARDDHSPFLISPTLPENCWPGPINEGRNSTAAWKWPWEGNSNTLAWVQTHPAPWCASLRVCGAPGCRVDLQLHSWRWAHLSVRTKTWVSSSTLPCGASWAVFGVWAKKHTTNKTTKIQYISYYIIKILVFNRAQ